MIILKWLNKKKKTLKIWVYRNKKQIKELHNKKKWFSSIKYIGQEKSTWSGISRIASHVISQHQNNLTEIKIISS